MNTLPALFEERMRKLLPEESEAFFAALQTEPPVSIRLNPGKPVPISRLFPDEQIGLPVSWCESAYYSELLYTVLFLRKRRDFSPIIPPL